LLYNNVILNKKEKINKCRQNHQKEECFIFKEKKADVAQGVGTKLRNQADSSIAMTAGLFSEAIMKKFPTV
jgi:uncharacterized protein YaiL (DUF2058 family)